ncbi:MAG: hypothetical protein ABUT39_18580 [Acidobacteriota bacterium]
MRSRTCTLILMCLLIAPVVLRAAEPCGERDLTFGCTKTEERGRLRAGCGVHEGARFFASEWRLYELQTEKVLSRVSSNADGIALVEIPGRHHWLILEGELVCSKNGGERAIPYRFLVERTGKDGMLQRAYTPETLMATGNWNEDTQLHYGAFRSRSVLGTEVGEIQP